ncbi:MAG TPA: hypothetical protein VMU62_05080 [Acidobacteriaceae bacterium]|nr:hypothetical protein [Acidobacteriaceae bacterium]
MRRVAATLLLLLAAILPLQPLVAQAEVQASIPICCRAHGAHHCVMMQMGMTRQMGMDAPRSWTAQTCPYAHLHHAVTTASVYLHPFANISMHHAVALLQERGFTDVPDLQVSSLYAPRGPPTLL